MPVYAKKTFAGRGCSAIRSTVDFTVTGTTWSGTALSDALDATYAKHQSSTQPIDMWCDNFPTIGAGERCVSVCPFVRSKQPGTKNPRFAVSWGWYDAGTNLQYLVEGLSMTLTPNAVVANYQVAAQNGQLLVPGRNVEWKYYQNTYPTISFYDPHTNDANRALWYDAGLYYYCLKAATVAAPTAPAGTVSTTQYPACTATVSAVVESWQRPAGLPAFYTGGTVEWSVYSGSLTAPSGTPLAKWTTHFDLPTYIDGTTASTLAVSTTPQVPLPNGALTLFARVTRDHPSADYSAAWSAYAYKQWTQSCPNPGAPALTPTLVDAVQKVTLQVNAPATSGYDSATARVQVQRQLASGGWRDVRGMMDVAVPTGVLMSPGPGADWEADRGATNTYRARASMWHTVDAVTRYSLWTTATVSGPTAGTWNLKQVDNEVGGDWLGVPISTGPSESSQAPAATLEPLDRDRPVVLIGTIGGFAGALEIVCSGGAAISLAKTLEAYRGRVYLEDAFGETRYLAVSKVSWSRQGTAAAPRRTATVEYVEISSGLPVSAS